LVDFGLAAGVPHPDRAIVATVGGAASRALLRRVAPSSRSSTLDTSPPTVQAPRIAVRQENRMIHFIAADRLVPAIVA